MFVCFEKDSGKINQITNEIPDQGNNFIEVEPEEVTTLLSGKENMSLYIVEFDPLEKMLKLRHRNNIAKVYIDIKRAVYKIPTINIDPDLEIIQDFDNTCWKFLLGDKLKINLKSAALSYNNNLTFSITKAHDPNLLYKVLRLNLKELIDKNYCILPFEMDFEKTNTSISIFTEKLFSNYKFTRIKNGQEI